MGLTVSEFADLHSLSTGRVHQLIRSGSVRAYKEGKTWRIASERPPGRLSRPLSSNSAWALIDMISGRDTDGLDRLTRHRVSKYATRLLNSSEPLLLLGGWLERRAPRLDVALDTSMRSRAERDPACNLVRSRAKAPDATIDVYVSPKNLMRLLSRYDARQSTRPNSRVWVADVAERFTPVAEPGLMLAHLADNANLANTVVGRREASSILSALRQRLGAHLP